jgi:hypothetical protein
VDEAPTTKVNEARVALVAAIANDPARAAEIILECKDLVLAFDDRLSALETVISIQRDDRAELERRMVNLEVDGVNEIRRLCNEVRRLERGEPVV